MFERFSHYLTYGATDQKTVLQLLGKYEGLIVPGTVAAFQRQGTGGFVLSLSATADAPPYLIDPRFPLFQRSLTEPKASHRALADLLGAPQLPDLSDPSPEDFDDALVATVAQGWVDFNRTYEDHQAGKFEKYAKRLHEPVAEDARRGPRGVIAPYLVAESDAWWERSDALMKATVAAAGTGPGALDVLRVLAVEAVPELDRRLGEIEDEQVILWVSGLKEPTVDPRVLTEYGEAIRAAELRGQATFALYGGFFSVLLGSVGLRGACHGIGYGEHRSWPELPQSGPPPARYYAPRFHRYINQDLAYQLWSRDSGLTACDCPVCKGGAPVLSYHDLMKHSVYARQAEIEGWSGLDLAEARQRLEVESAALKKDIEAAGLPDPILRPARNAAGHLRGWTDALEQLGAPRTRS